MSPLRAIIAGAGIGGLSAALALAGRGHAVTLVERRTGFAEAGAGIQLSPNASRVLLGLGLGQALQRAGAEPERVVIRALRSGAEIGGVALGRSLRERHGAPYLVIQRADLHTILLDAVRGRENIRLLVGREAVAVAQAGEEALLTVERPGGGREELAGDLVIGADGLWSRLRAAAGDLAPLRPQVFAAWRATIPREAVPEALARNETGLWLGPGCHVVHYPVAAGRLVNVVAVERRALPGEGWSVPGERAELIASFHRAAPPLRALLAAAEDWQLWPLVDRPPGPMARGRLALLGDAAHPVLPFLAQGGAMAIEDAAVLAECLAGEGGVEQRLARYARQRRPRTKRVQAEARRNAWSYHVGAFPLPLGRRLVFKALGPEGMARRYDWLFGWRA